MGKNQVLSNYSAFFNNINVVFILFVMEKFGDQNCTFEDPQGVVDANRITNRKDL